ncbi:MAG: DUF5597 domain-containing protein [Verrucomicrobiota bacterium]|jgi:hypothetical protein
MKHCRIRNPAQNKARVFFWTFWLVGSFLFCLTPVPMAAQVSTVQPADKIESTNDPALDKVAQALGAGAREPLKNLAAVLQTSIAKGRAYQVHFGSQNESRFVDLDDYRIVLTSWKGASGTVILVGLEPNEFVAFGQAVEMKFLERPDKKIPVYHFTLDSGKMADGHWIQGLRLNGDEYQPSLGELSFMKVHLY